MNQEFKHQLIIGSEYAGQRLDRVLSLLLPDYSRGRLQTWIRSGEILVNGKQAKPRDNVYGGELIVIQASFAVDQGLIQAQPIELNRVYQDDDIIVINKPAGLVVHPAAGHADHTLQNALVFHWPELTAIPRAGIVHRIDKLTSGLLVVARTLPAHQSLVAQLANKSVHRQYVAVVNGLMSAGGTIDKPVGRHPLNRKRMAVVDNGKNAVTHYRVVKRYRAHSLLKVWLETGRTHQIRVHMAAIQYALLGDPVYGGKPRLPRQACASLIETIQQFKRQALHAQQLGLVHPRTGEEMQFNAELPPDMHNLCEQLQLDAEQNQGN